MRVALLGPAGSVHLVQWANGLTERGHDVHVLSAHPASPDLNVNVVVHPLVPRAPLGYVFAVGRLRRTLSEIAPDILHAHYATGYGWLGRRARYRPYVLSVWGSDVLVFPKRSRLHGRFVQRNLDAADLVCSTSRSMAADVIALSPAVPLAVIPFGVRPDQFVPRAGGRRREQTVGTVKALHHTYGVDTLLLAFAEVSGHLAERAPGLALRIVGDGPDRSKLEDLARRLGIAHSTTFVGSVPHSGVPAELAELDVYVALSRSESFGVAVLEASAAELPVVVSSVGGLPEVVDNEVTGLVVPPDDVAAAASAIERLLVEPELGAQFGRAGRAMVVDRYSMSACLDQLEAAYMSVRRAQA